MKKICILFSTLIICGGLNAQDWNWLSPKPQGNTLNSVFFTDVNVGYAVGEAGTLMKTSDNGNSWNLIETGFYCNITSVFFTSATTGFMVTASDRYGKCNIYRTRDEGMTWTRVYKSEDGDLLTVFFINDRIGFAGGFSENLFFEESSVLLVTRDGGDTWENIDINLGQRISSIYFTSQSRGYISSCTGHLGGYGSIGRTDDGGLTWSVISTGSLNSIAFVNLNTGIAVGERGKIIKTSDGGNSWLEIESGVLNDLFKVLFINENVGYATGSKGTILKTENTGETWIKMDSLTPYDLYSFGYDKNTHVSCVVGINGIILTNLAGSDNWNNASTSNTVDLSSIFFTDENTGYMCGTTYWGNEGVVLKTSDAGNSWSKYYPGTQGLQSVFFVNSDIGYISGRNSTVIKTSDGGNSWNLLSIPTTSDYYLGSIFFTDVNTGYVLGTYYNSFVLIKTTDGGVSWNIILDGYDKGYNSMFFTDQNTGYIVGYDEFWLAWKLLKTTDGGASWSTTNFGFYNPLYAVYFTDKNTGFIGGLDQIIKTTDGGKTWVKTSCPVSGYFSSFFFPTSNIGYALGSGGTILKTDDSGDNWKQLPIHSNKSFSSVFFTSKNVGYVISGGETVLKTINGGTGIDKEIQNYPLQIYPNPASDKIIIEIPKSLISGSIHAFISIHNAIGQIVTAKTTREMKTEIDVSSFSEGIYIISLKTKEGNTFGKFIRQ